MCPPPLLCLLHINVTYTQSPTTPHWPCKVHTHTHQPIPVPQYLFTTNISHNDTHTPHTQPHPLDPHTTTHTPRIHPNTSHSHPPHTPTYIHYPKHPNLHPIPHKHKTLHYNIFKVSNLLQYTYCIAVPLQLLSLNT